MSDEERIEQLELEVKVLRANNKGLKDKIDEQSNEIEELKEKYSDSKIRDTIIKRYREVIEKDYISKDKIKAKIEELEKQDRENRMSHNYLVIPVLQSLLEKE